MKEIEIKVLDVNEEEIISKVIENNAKKVADVLIHEKYYDFDDEKLTKNNEILRLRKAGDKVDLGHKRKKSDPGGFLVFDEFETIVNDFDTMNIIIENLGMKPIIDREKRRVTLSYNKLIIEIHKYPSIPAWLELEGTEEDIKDFLSKLGYNMKNTSSLTDNEILKKYGANVSYQRMDK
tara:strand:- start:14160 stop:14696 length:537 start_codon:yes stop_codon:yes gene_type:complete